MPGQGELTYPEVMDMAKTLGWKLYADSCDYRGNGTTPSSLPGEENQETGRVALPVLMI
ncbi:MAG: hypothetical protein ACLTSL_11275 [Odoribacter splanchnicus]